MQSTRSSMDPFKEVPDTSANPPMLTQRTGAPAWDHQNSLTIGGRGPALLEDYQLVEKLAVFDRERIPERVVHARGIAAKGYFECTADITHLTVADPFRAVGARTPLLFRFSTQIFERESPEALREPRGMAIKFYTNDGNWDLVGNNIPVFFVRDGIEFPDMIHALKPNPKTNIQDWWRIWDFFSYHPESCHMFMYVLDDVGIPRDFRHMEGFGVNTFALVNRDNKATYVKFQYKPTCGIEYIASKEEATRIAGTCHSHASKDLYETIAAGNNFPEWTLYIQTMEVEDEDKFEFDPLDVTKVWPEDRFPLQEVGRIVLNQNIDNFHTESEMSAFAPSVIIPGIAFTDDRMLQTRIFSYPDTQRHRLGGNYLMLPINAPRNFKYQHCDDGFMNFAHQVGDVNYFPSHYSGACSSNTKFGVMSHVVSGVRRKTDLEKTNNFQQAGERWRWFDADRKDRFIERLSDFLTMPGVTDKLRDIWHGYFSQCDEELGARLRAALDAKRPADADKFEDQE